MTQVLTHVPRNSNKGESELLQDLLTTVVRLDPEFARRDFYEEEFVIHLEGFWMVIRTVNADTFDFMRLDRALRSRITERGWLYGIGVITSIVAGKPARICIPTTPQSKTIWIWENHEYEDAIALLKAYVTALVKTEELKNANASAA